MGEQCFAVIAEPFIRACKTELAFAHLLQQIVLFGWDDQTYVAQSWDLQTGTFLTKDELDPSVTIAPDGRLLGRIRLPEVCGNICFGGPKRNVLFMAASQSIYALPTATQGAGFS